MESATNTDRRFIDLMQVHAGNLQPSFVLLRQCRCLDRRYAENEQNNKKAAG